MIKRICVTMVVLALSAQMVAADTGNTNPNDLVGIFQYNQDIGGPAGYGFTMDIGNGIEPGLGGSREYLLTGGGADIWGTWDQMHMAYNLVEGNVRVSANIAWVAKGNNEWSKYGVMLRDPSADGGSTNYSVLTRRDENLLQYQGRSGTGEGSWGSSFNADVKPWKLGIQRVSSGGWTVIQGLYDDGSGWKSNGMTVNPANLPEQMMAGVVVTSHDNRNLVQIRVKDVMYENNIDLIGVPTVTGAGPDACSDIPGFNIRVKARDPQQPSWDYVGARDLMDGVYQGAVLPAMGFPPFVFEASRLDPVVNLSDVGDGAFGDNRSFPGIDNPMEFPTADPAQGDDDNDFATEVTACIYLTQGIHVIGANSDDGTIITIGGVEIGRTGEWKGASNVDFLFQVAEEGWYSFNALSLEGGGGASLELHEIFSDGTRILLGQTDGQGNFLGSPVYAVPEPTTIALLGLGGLSLIRRKRS